MRPRMGPRILRVVILYRTVFRCGDFRTFRAPPKKRSGFFPRRGEFYLKTP